MTIILVLRNWCRVFLNIGNALKPLKRMYILEETSGLLLHLTIIINILVMLKYLPLEKGLKPPDDVISYRTLNLVSCVALSTYWHENNTKREQAHEQKAFSLYKNLRSLKGVFHHKRTLEYRRFLSLHLYRGLFSTEYLI